MNSTLALTPSARAALISRLNSLLAEHAQAQAESALPAEPGDAADRVGNIDAMLRLGDLDSRIAAVQQQLDAPERDESAAHDVVGVGDRIVVRFPDGAEPETYLVGFIEQAGSGTEVITPASPLGRALLGKRPGEVVRFRAETGAPITVELVDIAAA